MKALSDFFHENQANIIESFNSTSRYLDDLLNIDNEYFEQMVDTVNPKELRLNTPKTSDTEAPFLDLNLSISYDIISIKIYDKRDDFVLILYCFIYLFIFIFYFFFIFHFLDGDAPRATSYGIYISQLFLFARASSQVLYFNNRNKF